MPDLPKPLCWVKRCRAYNDDGTLRGKPCPYKICHDIHPDHPRWNSPPQPRPLPLPLPPRPPPQASQALHPLHRLILGWNLGNEVDDPSASSVPAAPMQTSFEDLGLYRRVVCPLVELELWAQIKETRSQRPEETAWKVTEQVMGQGYMDLYLDCEERLPERLKLWTTDVVTLWTGTPTGTPILAKVESFVMKSDNSGATARVRCVRYPPTSVVNMTLRVSVALDLVSTMRECTALGALEGSPLLASFLKPGKDTLPSISVAEIDQAKSAHGLNTSQARAVVGCNKKLGFSFIKGPPGTGKTTTIRGLVGTLLSPSSAPGATNARSVATAAPKDKILLCAHSNAGVREMAGTLSQGVRDNKGAQCTPVVVLIARNVPASLEGISLKHQVAERIRSRKLDGNLNTAWSEVDRLQHQLREAKKRNRPIIGLHGDLKRARDRVVQESRALRKREQEEEQKILLGADVVCCTLNSAGRPELQGHRFVTVIIDEAGQATELASLIPLQYGCRRCIMIGDCKQLDPTVKSRKAKNLGLGRSLFERLQALGRTATYVLDIQYRMHPEISAFPNILSYDGRLRDGPNMARKRAKPWHAEAAFPPYCFFDVADGIEVAAGSHSWTNEAEIDMIVELCGALRARFSTKDELDHRIGIISMYASQDEALQDRFVEKFGLEVLRTVEFNTVDGYQGREKDIIIMTCTRGGPDVSSIGFLDDKKRANVGLTRARCSLFVLGNAATLEKDDQVWKPIIENARERSLLVELVDPEFFKQARPAAVIPSPVAATTASPSKTETESEPTKRKREPEVDEGSRKKDRPVPDKL